MYISNVIYHHWDTTDKMSKPIEKKGKKNIKLSMPSWTMEAGIQSGLPALSELFKTKEKNKNSKCNYPSLFSSQCEQHYSNGFHILKLIKNNGGISQACCLSQFLSISQCTAFEKKKTT